MFQIVEIVQNFGHVELSVLVTTLANILVYIYGSRKNRSIARNFFNSLNSVLAENFSRVDPLQEESADSFSVYATGSKVVSGLTLTLTLRSRQDVLTALIGAFTSSKAETLTLEFQDLETREDHVLGALARRGLWKSVLEQFPLLRRHQRDVSTTLPFLASGDSAEISDLLAKSIDTSALADLDEFVVADGGAKTKIRISDHTEILVRSLVGLVSKISGLCLSEKSRTAAKELREVRESEAQRKERLDKKKADKYKAMSPEERAKFDKKIEKKILIKQAKRH